MHIFADILVHGTSHVHGTDGGESRETAAEVGQLRVAVDVQGATDSLQLRHGDVGELTVSLDVESLLNQGQVGGAEGGESVRVETEVTGNVGERRDGESGDVAERQVLSGLEVGESN